MVWRNGMAGRGASIEDLPVYSVNTARRTAVSGEAVRGGAHLGYDLKVSGFAFGYHPAGELAP